MAYRFSKGSDYFRRYFYSGWVFLTPYLAVYLLYRVLRWPVNADAQLKALSLKPPALLHVYWTLHLINAMLAAITLVSWWRWQEEEHGRPETGDGRRESGESRQSSDCLTRSRETTKAQTTGILQEVAKCADESGREKNEDRSLSPSLSLSLKIAPWALLTLLFWIPGVYLEWPADPWEHYARINEWSGLHTVGEHWAWAKSGYFFAYSFLGQISPPTRQLFWLAFYYTGCCLLLCWQYYRFARSVGLGERASMLFVVLQTVLFGNNIFGFYRYYGISSSIFAQIGAVALVRVAIELASAKLQISNSKSQGAGASPSVADFNTEDAETTENEPAEAGVQNSNRLTRRREGAKAQTHLAPSLKLKALGPLPCPPFSFQLLAFAISAALLATLIAFNHVQGLGIAGLGLLAVGIWRLIEWRRSIIWWLAVGALVLSVTAVLWFPRHPAIDQLYRPNGWLTSWYGFNVFAFSLPVGDRTLQIIGLFGLVNVAAGLLLLRCNHLVGWLTLVPLFALCLPFIAIPFAGALAHHGDPSNIITFQRMLFAIPPSLALVALLEGKFQIPKPKSQGTVPEISQEQTKGAENFEAEGSLTTDEHGLPRIQNASLPSLPSVKSSREIAAKADRDQIACPFDKLRAPSLSRGKQTPPVSRFPYFTLSRFSARFHLSAVLLSPFSLLLVVLTALLLVPANRPFYNRFWQSQMVPPNDLTMSNVVEVMATPAIRNSKTGVEIPLLSTLGQGAVAAGTGYKNTVNNWRTTWVTDSAVPDLPGEVIATQKQKVPAFLLAPQTAGLYSTASLSGYLSNHWLPRVVALENTAGPEIEKVAKEVGARKIDGSHGMLYSIGNIPVEDANGPH